MKILCEFFNSGPFYVRNAWKKVFEEASHKFIWWNPKEKSAFDVFSENDPIDLFIGTSCNVDKAIFKCVKARPKMKVILFGSSNSNYISSIDTKKYKIDIASEEEKQWITKLKTETGEPRFIFIHITDKNLEQNMGGWRKCGVEPIGILNAADIFTYLNGQHREFLKTDLVFIGGYWHYKGRNLNDYILPLCDFNNGLKMKIFAGTNQHWTCSQFLGYLPDELARDAFVSATVCPNVSESHSTDLGFDIVERPFKVMSSGGFCISDYVEEAREIFNENELIMAKTPAEFEKLIRHYIKKPEERKPFIEAGLARVLKSETYHHRIYKMLLNLGIKEEADKILNNLNKRLNNAV